ncbi:MAG: class I SAM-dependent methyltransferase [Gammaproteobacteria bacterium]|nr:class I SAM-dependent rRNA methyltransferase [Rhodocyclaceae bacterium]MBU3909149.1 class I SAM-dependent methyltransferase [Gammaproteobacteria bacterium]MBU3988342.1 class I SAM-dependent methyltransferase [Gammaproteobacteria bacterium]MBU4005691.1 class I SAM-dependent methyltransferase [Gammaproteobacteria bacterium]MBU4020756.1 class I SAM-dependent methyltransferase [Gammaproteobacteria bacterium]
MSANLIQSLAAALDSRAALLRQLHTEETDAYRLFHGSVEGQPGLTVDRYGELLLIQTFHSPLPPAQLAALEDFYARTWPELIPLYNDRSAAHSRIGNPLPPEQLAQAVAPRTVRELGVNYRIQGRHDGQDPWLFLDLRAGRRRVMQEAPGKSLLNLFAYTCGVGIAAAHAGARHVVNVDFAASSLAVGRENARLNELAVRPRFVQSDVFAALRQLAGLGQAKMVRGKRMPAFPPLEARTFDLVFLDPPRYARSPFGVVDLINDYPALFKPALLCTAPGGTLICCNNVAQVAREVWLDQLERSARKIDRPIRAVEWITPEADFPSHDDQPPLKIALLRV